METRRSLLAALGAVSLGGCLGGPGDGSSTESTPTESPHPPTETRAIGESVEPPDSIETSWPMPGQNPGRSNHVPGASGPTARLGNLWKVSTSTSLSAPVLAGETVYVGGDSGDLWAINARTGAKRWTRSVGETAGTPRAFDGTLYVPTGAGVAALSAADGTEEWSVDVPERAGLLVAPHGVYFLAGADGDTPTVVALTRDGEERWQVEISKPWEPTLFADDEHVFVPTDTLAERPWILGVDGETVLGDEDLRRAEDAIGEEFVRDGRVFALDGMFGELEANTADDDYENVWSQSVEGYGSGGLSGDGERVYYGTVDDAGVYAFSAANGDTTWHVETEIEVRTPPVVADDAVVVTGEETVRCFDPADGTERWRHSAEPFGPRSLVVDDVLVTVRDGVVRAFRSVEA